MLSEATEIRVEQFCPVGTCSSLSLPGEEVGVALYGAAQDANVRLDKSSIRVENTFISLVNQRTVVISNRSGVIAHFRWSQFATREEEDQQRMM